MAGALAGTLVLYLIFASPNSIPRVDIDEQLPDFDPADKVVTGDIIYSVSLNFDDGSKKTFSQVVNVGELALGSITAGGKKLTSIDAEATALMKLPKNTGPDVTRTMYTESTASLLLNGQTIGGKSFSNYFGFERLNDKVQLWKFSVPASSVMLSTGTYALSLQSVDQFRFVVNGENRIMKVASEPITFGLENDAGILKELYVATYSPAASAKLEKLVKDGRSAGYNINVKASGFKPLSEIKFTYVDRSVSSAPQDPSNPKYSVLLGKGQVKMMTDPLGSALDVTKVKGGASQPDGEDYYAHYIVSDGENYAFGLAGTSWRVDSGRGENPGFYIWPPMKNGVIDMEKVNALIAKGGPFLRDPT